MKTKYFENYQSKLTLEAILKSALCGIAIGCGANFIAALIFWLVGVEALWALILILVGVSVLMTPLFFYARFRPSDVTNARCLDRLGLEERMITMVELEGEDSIITRLQREDAKAALKTVDKKQIKIKIPKVITTLAIVFFVLGAGMTTVNALSEGGLLPGGDELIDSFIEEQTTVYVTLTYIIEDGGVIEGDEEQVIVLGTDGTTVTAVADDGYMFKEWSDGHKDPSRTDFEVTESAEYTAIFTPMEDEEGEGEGDGEGEGEGEGEQDEGAPSDRPNNGDQEGPSGTEGEPNEDAQTGGGENKPNNQIVDGKTFYREVLEYYQGLADEEINSEDCELSPEEIELIKQYLGIV